MPCLLCFWPHFDTPHFAILQQLSGAAIDYFTIRCAIDAITRRDITLLPALRAMLRLLDMLRAAAAPLRYAAVTDKIDVIDGRCRHY